MPGTWTVEDHLRVLASSLEDSSTLPYTSGLHSVGEDELGLYYNVGSEGDEARYIDFRAPTDEQVEQLASACERASFGRGQEDVLDESYRKAGKIDVSRFAARLDIAANGILDAITPYLVEGRSGDDEEMGLTAEMYKLNVYGPGSFFKAHKDTPCSEDMIGSLVVVLPTTHAGGALTLTHNSHQGLFDSASRLSAHPPNTPAVAYVGFYSDVVHSVEPVTAGYRVTLTYNLFLRKRRYTLGTRISPPSELAFETSLRALVADGSFMSRGGLLAFGLSHQYPIPRGSNQNKLTATANEEGDEFNNGSHAHLRHILKGNDARIRSAATRVGLGSFVRLVYETMQWGAPNAEEVLVGSELDLEWIDPNYHNLRWEIHKLGSLLERQDIKGNVLPTQGEYDDARDEDEDEEKELIPVYWVVKRQQLNQVDSRYIAMGNQASIEHVYGDAALFISIPALGEKGREDVVAVDADDK
ncbi:hypothetical protein C8F01DRAFT_668752 [Mycena amicta]|nr:hypothetical protein C8F01DRAFT_668752 [Mycena amicta]